MQKVSSQSTKTLVAPISLIAPTVAMKVLAAVMTSSPCPTPTALSGSFSASVPEPTPMACLVPATMDLTGPSYIRVAKGGDPIISVDANGFEIGKSIPMRPAGEVMFITTGIMTNRALTAAEALAGEGIEAGVQHHHTIKPLDETAILNAARKVSLIVVAEEHSKIGGLGGAVSELLAGAFGAGGPQIVSLGVADVFTDKYGSQDDLLELYGLQPDALAGVVRDAVGKARLAAG